MYSERRQLVCEIGASRSPALTQIVVHMVKNHQNEIPPIFYYGISTKTSEKDLKIPNLQALTLGRIIKITLYYKK